MPILKPEHEPVLIRLSVCANGEEALKPAAVYLLVTGFFKIIHELDVYSYRYEFDRRGLSFYIEVRDSRSATKAYLDKIKQFHVLGRSWSFQIIEGGRISLIRGLSQENRPLDGKKLESMARSHMSMGSRPLRFSRYFLYSALVPYSRMRGYGCCLFNREDAKGLDNFNLILQGIEILTRSFSAIDFSDISSLEELRKKGRLIENAVSDYSGRPGLLKGLLFQSLVLATIYERKTAFEKIPEEIINLTKGLDRDFKGEANSDGIKAYMKYGAGGVRKLAMTGFSFVLDQALPFYRTRMNMDDLSLFILANTVDTTTLADSGPDLYEEIKNKADRAVFPGDVDRDTLNELFYKQGLVTRGVRDLISITILLDLIEKEDDLSQE